MKGDGPSEEFVSEVHRVLHHLYDPAGLGESPLLQLLAVDRDQDALTAVQQILMEAIQALEPAAGVPLHSNAWRIHQVLTWRYVEQSKQRDVAASLAISPRQLRRLEWAAARVLSKYLWTQYDLKRVRDPGTIPSAVRATRPDAETPSRAQELEWLKAFFPSESADIAGVISSCIETVDPLARLSNTRVTCEIPLDLPPVAGQLVAIRQALTSLLTAAIRALPEGELRIAAEPEHQTVCVHVQGTDDHPASSAQRAEITEHLDMAHQFANLVDGRLEVLPRSEDATSFAAKMVLPSAEQVQVLVIDDNVDTLRLLERYLSGTRYRFIGRSDPEEALALAEESAPQIIVLDIMLPGVDGWQFLGRLREHPRIRDVPILVCTILPQDRLAMTLGAAGFIRKPVRREELLGALNRQMRLRESH